MALTQMQIIQSLGEAMNWLEREISWGANPTELTHLMGRIGELYVTMYTNGNMADNVNEKGYDVVTKDNERISVKTTSRTSSQGHVSFNPNTLQFVDRVIILRFNAEEMELEILLDKTIEEAKALMTANSNGKLYISMSKIYKPNKKVRNDSEVAVIKHAMYKNYEIRELESGSIEVYDNGAKQSVVKPVLRDIAGEISVPLFNSNGNPFNTRQLGTFIIKSLSQVDEKTYFESIAADVKHAVYRDYEIKELESGTIEVYDQGERQSMAMPVLKEIAEEISVPLLNSKRNPYNTRQLGTLIIKNLNQG